MAIINRGGKPYCDKCMEEVTDVAKHLRAHGIFVGRTPLPEKKQKPLSPDAQRMENQSEKLIVQHATTCKCSNPNGTTVHETHVEETNKWWAEYVKLQNEGKL